MAPKYTDDLTVMEFRPAFVVDKIAEQDPENKATMTECLQEIHVFAPITISLSIVVWLTTDSEMDHINPMSPTIQT